LIKINLLSSGFVFTNTRSFIFPLIKYEKALIDSGIILKLYTSIDESIFDCDCIFIESNYHGKRWGSEQEKIIDEIERLKYHKNKLFYFDLSDSTALLHPEILSQVDSYFKMQKLKNTAQYKDLHYGNRIFTDYVYREYNINDSNPSYSVPVKHDNELKKIKVSWNSGYYNHTLLGKYLNELYFHVPIKPLLKFPCKFHKPILNRMIDISCRINTNYERATVAWFRKEAKSRLNNRIRIDRVSARDYYREMAGSKLCISPYAWGEINYKDYEAFISGCILLKPDMSHLETWPNYYINNKTYIPYKWDSSDLVEKTDNVLSGYEEFIEIANYSQLLYRNSLIGRDAENNFVDRLKKILN
tara:strand:- start:6304 stop:7377 length:1074 start_codon:yes stop_codon:yes gene_type:complete